MLFLQNRPAEMAEIENIHCTICTQPISSSWPNALPPVFASNEQRSVLLRSFKQIKQLSEVLDYKLLQETMIYLV